MNLEFSLVLIVQLSNIQFFPVYIWTWRKLWYDGENSKIDGINACYRLLHSNIHTLHVEDMN